MNIIKHTAIFCMVNEINSNSIVGQYLFKEVKILEFLDIVSLSLCTVLWQNQEKH